MKFSFFTSFSKKEKNKKRRTDTGSFSDFFLNASEKEQKEVITKAAKQANEEQRKVLFEARVLSKR
jgi:hypothetical protein